VDDEFNDFNYYRGNVYTKNAINEDGTVKVVTSDDIVYDTLSNGQVVPRNLPGTILQVPISSEDAYLRTNFDASDNRNFRDGDRRSSRYYTDNFDDNGDGTATDTKQMYNSPRHEVTTDSTGAIVRLIDKSNNRTSL